MYTVKMLVWYITLVGVPVFACDFGEPMCPSAEKTVQWRCLDNQELSVGAFWGREEGDDTTCTKEKSSKSQLIQDCPGDDQKAIDAVYEWCGDNVNENGECVIKAPTEELRFNGEKYDPCPGVLKYLKVCTECKCREFSVGVVTDKYKFYGIMRMVRTNKNNIAVLNDMGLSTSVINTQGDRITQLTEQHFFARYSDIAIQGDVIFISQNIHTAESSNAIHVIKEDGTFIKIIDTDSIGIEKYIECLAVRGNKLYVATSLNGLYVLTFDTNYTILNKTLLVPPSGNFSHPARMFVTQSQIVVLTYLRNIYYFHVNGTERFPPVSNEVIGEASDFALDDCGLAYVMNNEGVVILSRDGKYIKKMQFTGVELLNGLSSIFLQNDTMCIAYMSEVVVIKLQ